MPTKTMSIGAHNLELYGDNDSDIYRRYKLPTHKNLANKRARGVYDSAKAVTAFMYVADAAAKAYAKEHGSAGGRNWHLLFPVRDRREYARAMEREFRNEYDLGAYENYLTEATRKYLRKREAPTRTKKVSTSRRSAKR